MYFQSVLGRTRTKAWTLLSVLSCALVGLSVNAPSALAGPGGLNPSLIVDELVSGAMSGAVAADWLPDGRMVVLTRPGSLWAIDPISLVKSSLGTVADVDSRGESGALDLVVDPNFATNHALYVFYTALSDLRLRIGKLVTDGGATTVVGNTTLWSNPGPRRDVYSGPPSFHMGGSLDIGPDGKFYLSIGDAQAQQSQEMGNVFGKLLRINLDGSVPLDNPGLSAAVPEIYAYGLRNPFRGGFERVRSHANPVGSATLPYWAGDVGGNVAESAYEEINIVEAGRNYGWPFCEGPVGANGNPQHTTCPSGVTGPVYSYPHTAGVACCFNKAVIGGQMYRNGPFPLQGFYVYGDYPSETISWLQFAADGRTVIDSGQLIKLSARTAGWIDIGPDGAIYYIDLYHGSLRRLTYPGGTNSPAVITASSATPTSGLGPLTVQFTGAAIDYEGDAIAYAWNFGDGATSNTASPSHLYTQAGVFQARLQVTSSGQVTNGEPISINVGAPPIPSITGVTNGGTFTVGDTLVANGSATDPVDGPIPAGTLEWSIDFLHDNHVHPVGTGTGASISLPISVSGHDYSGKTGYRIALTATNSSGLKGTTQVEVWAKKILIPVRASVLTTGVVSGITQALPFNIDTVPGYQHTLEVPETVCQAGLVYTFAAWSDGQARIHSITATDGLAPVASYGPSGVRCRSKYMPLTPQRVFDSRSGAKPAAGTPIFVPVVGQGGVPAGDVTAVILNVTAVEAQEAGFVTVWPSGSPVPNSSNLNLRAGETAPNLVTVSPGSDGAVAILPTTSAHILVDIFGYYTSASSSVDGRYVPLASPQRLYDTRSLEATPHAGAIRNVVAAGAVGVPAKGAEAVVLNVTAVEGLAPGFVTVWPSGTTVPNVSNINLDHVGQTRPNQVIVKLGLAGAFSLYTSGGAHLIVDVVGYFTAATPSGVASSSGLFIPALPVRLMDTRGTQPAANERTDLAVLGRSGVPAEGVLAIVANTTAVQATDAGFVTAFPGQQPLPNTSTLNVEAGQTIANHSTTTIGSGGVSFQATTGVDLLLDLEGWYIS